MLLYNFWQELIKDLLVNAYDVKREYGMDFITP